MNDNDNIDSRFLHHLRPADLLQPACRAGEQDSLVLCLDADGVMRLRYHRAGSAIPAAEASDCTTAWTLPVNPRAHVLRAWVEANLDLFNVVLRGHELVLDVDRGEWFGWFDQRAMNAHGALIELIQELTADRATVTVCPTGDLIGLASITGGLTDEEVEAVVRGQIGEDGFRDESRWCDPAEARRYALECRDALKAGEGK